MLVAGLDGKIESRLFIAHVVIVLILRAQLAQDMLGLLGRRFGDVYLLETAHEPLGTREVPVIFLVGGRADKADGTTFEIRLEHVRGVHRTLTDGTCTHQRMDLVDIDDVAVALLLDAVHDLFDAVLEVTTILCAGKQSADIELVDAATLQTFGHSPLLDHPGESPDEGCLADAWFSDVQGIVLVATTEHLYRALQFFLAAYQGIVFLIVLVHAGHQFPPGILMFLDARILFQMVLVFKGGDKLTHEVTQVVAQQFLQQETRPGFFKMEDARHEVRDVERLCTTVQHLFAGKRYHLFHLLRSLRLILLVRGYHFHLAKFFFEFVGKFNTIAELAESLVKRWIVGEHEQQVLRRHELVSEFFTTFHSEMQRLGCTLCLFHIS